MSFQAYLDNIHAKTGMTPEAFKAAAEEKGLLAPALTAAQFIAWLKLDYDLGRGHAMAVYTVFKAKGWVVGAKPRS